jgi:threonyl-tRNA synthetase
MLVVGDREVESGAVSVRNRKEGDQGAKSVAQFVETLKELVDTKAVGP